MENIVKAYIDRMQGLKAEHGETVYSYYVELGNTSRLSGCEMNIRLIPNRVVLTAVLPINLCEEEYYGISCRLAKYNRDRLNKDEDGMFELNTLRSRIQFMVELEELADEAELTEQIDYCLNEVKRYSETMLHMVCDESNAVYEAEREKLENERKAAERVQRTRQYRNTPVMGKLMSFLGIIDEEIEDEMVCLEAPADPDADAGEEKAEQKTEENKAEEAAQE